MGNEKGWWGVDLDGTLAHYDGWNGPTHIGDPIPLMLEHVKKLLAEGRRVKIFTARVYSPLMFRESVATADALRRDAEAKAAETAIKAWCLQHLGQELEVTCVKDFGMVQLWDDRAMGVRCNEGIFV